MSADDRCPVARRSLVPVKRNCPPAAWSRGGQDGHGRRLPATCRGNRPPAGGGLWRIGETVETGEPACIAVRHSRLHPRGAIVLDVDATGRGIEHGGG